MQGPARVLHTGSPVAAYDAHDPMNTPSPPSPTFGPVDLSESVAGEEDPGASLDLPPAAPTRPATGGNLCPSCGGSGKIAAGTCPDCKGSGQRTAGFAGA